MGVEFIFRARISSHGGGRLIIYIPKELAQRARKLYEEDREVIVIVATEG
ncbi:hypothetical protein [Vulcanisaeta souniana]|uniref:Uncharacterized protein n=1 Tax=Vulcanisaeta souniana JCM 11219 TaxID=1293586 RepID=A0A830E989_9CREN|nr:hypothetical protein [Vulcanisaeta souniana]BDR92959.1 hypothetical protein Vsou_20520 [Vulcanisaeta souniana JCM 11219]GGI83904.1 hypothetical protein GCM10007112_20980 [Vulcanisaeta souniana JCM 11219]